MGQICGVSHEPYEFSVKELDLFKELRLSKEEIERLLKSFNDIDVDGSRKVRMDELFGSCRIEETSCNKKIFGIFDSDGSGTLTFSEFGTNPSPLSPSLSFFLHWFNFFFFLFLNISLNSLCYVVVSNSR